MSIGDIANRPPYMGDDRNYQGPAQPGWQPGAQALSPVSFVSVARQPRAIVPAQIWLTNMAVNFTSVANENVVGFSRTQNFDVLMWGAWANLISGRARLAVNGTQRDFSIEQVPVQIFAGLSTKIQPVRWYKHQFILQADNSIRGDWTNIGTEAAGRVVFFAERYPSNERRRRLVVEDSMLYWSLVDLSLTGLFGFSSPLDDPLLIWGAQTNVAASVLATVTDDHNNYSWMAEPLPVHSYAAVVSEVQPIVYYPKPYFLDARAKLRLNYSAATAGGYCTFLCERLLRWHWADDAPAPAPVRVRPPVPIVKPTPVRVQPPVALPAAPVIRSGPRGRVVGMAIQRTDAAAGPYSGDVTVAWQADGDSRTHNFTVPGSARNQYTGDLPDDLTPFMPAYLIR